MVIVLNLKLKVLVILIKSSALIFAWEQEIRIAIMGADEQF